MLLSLTAVIFYGLRPTWLPMSFLHYLHPASTAPDLTVTTIQIHDNSTAVLTLILILASQISHLASEPILPSRNRILNSSDAASATYTLLRPSIIARPGRPQASSFPPVNASSTPTLATAILRQFARPFRPPKRSYITRPQATHHQPAYVGSEPWARLLQLLASLHGQQLGHLCCTVHRNEAPSSEQLQAESQSVLFRLEGDDDVEYTFVRAVAGPDRCGVCGVWPGSTACLY